MAIPFLQLKRNLDYCCVLSAGAKKPVQSQYRAR